MIYTTKVYLADIQDTIEITLKANSKEEAHTHIKNLINGYYYKDCSIEEIQKQNAKENGTK